MRRHATLLCLLPLLLAGCGDRTPSDTEQVRTLLGTFATATQKRDYQTLCQKVLAPRLLSGLQEIGLPCEVAMRNSLGDVRNPRLTVGTVSVHGTRATAQVRTSADNQPPSTDTVHLVKGKGGWRISALGGGRTP